MNSIVNSPRIAVVGAGISGLGAALSLVDNGYRVSLFEANDRLGGHAHTVEVALDGLRHPVDTGFLVFNHPTYPLLLSLFKRLSVPCAKSDMSFSVSQGPHLFEWAGSNLRSLFAQPGNTFRIGFWRMLLDIARFNRQASAIASRVAASPGSVGMTDAVENQSLDEFLIRNRYSRDFRDRYLLPMAAAIWSCPMSTMREFPLGSFVRFFHNHGLLKVFNRPQWYTVAGGSREYVNRIASELSDVRLAAPVSRLTRRSGGVELESRFGREQFDHVILACHSNQAIAMLTDPSPLELSLLGGVRYQPNFAILHTDVTAMPKRTAAWSAWNYLSNGDVNSPQVSLTYWLNRLQPLPFDTPLLLSLNPITDIDTSKVLARFEYEHPILDRQAATAVSQLPSVQGERNTWFAGAWLGFGFHEDGLRSGLQAAHSLHQQLQSLRQSPANRTTELPRAA